MDRQLYNRAKKKQYGIIVLSSATDPYLPIDQEYQLTRDALKLIYQYKFPVHVITKSHLIERDFDLLHQINRESILPHDLTNKLQGGVIVSFSFSTLGDDVAHIFESGATPPSERIKTVKQTIKEGFHSGINLMPLLPYISDTTESLNRFYSTFKSLNVKYILPSTITLFGKEKASSETLILKAIEKHYPKLLPKYQKFFLHNDQMPVYYRRAFDKKMKELSKEYKIPKSILL